MSIAEMLRSEIDRLVRPGQPSTAVVCHRAMDGSVFMPGDQRRVRELQMPEGRVVQRGVYGRCRYGQAQYAAGRR
ncbi:hypothetical protein LLH03_07890 [bacterium]|nr:hypothetical protein [bacterium]